MASADHGDLAEQQYLRQAASLLELPLPVDRELRVLQHFCRTVEIARPLLDFPLPDRIDLLVEFEP